MQTYHNTIQETNGDIITTALVYVYDSLGGLADIFLADESTQINNPFDINDPNYDIDGSFWFKAVNGIYDIKIVNGEDESWKRERVLFDFSDNATFGGNVGIGVAPIYKLDVVDGGANTTRSSSSIVEFAGSNSDASSRSGTLMLNSNSDMGAGKGGSIAFGGRWKTSNTSQYGFAVIKGGKANGTTGVAGGALVLSVADAAGSMSDVVVLDEAQLATFRGDISLDNGKRIIIDQGINDTPFINYKAAVDADATSAISSLTTSGATTHHIQVDINGTKAWIAVSTNNPS